MGSRTYIQGQIHVDNPIHVQVSHRSGFLLTDILVVAPKFVHVMQTGPVADPELWLGGGGFKMTRGVPN